MYEIISVTTEYSILEMGKIERVIVLWLDGKYLRATYSETTPIQGFDYLKPNDINGFTNHVELSQRVAGYGRYISEPMKKKYFSHIKNWSK